MKQKLIATYERNPDHSNWKYLCKIYDQEILEDSYFEIVGKHSLMGNHLEVDSIKFDECKLTKIPQGLTKIFFKLKSIELLRTDLKFIHRDDLKEYSSCRQITLNQNKIEFLPGDLFTDMKRLKYIDIHSNKIQIIEPNLLDGLKNLKELTLNEENVIDKMFHICGRPIGCTSTLDEIKEDLRQKFATVSPSAVEKKRLELKLRYHDGVGSDLKKLTRNYEFEDFTVNVEDQEFRVNKFLLAARCPVIREMIQKDLDAKFIDLTGISAQIFHNVVTFLYTDNGDKIPYYDNEDIDYLELFKAGEKLKLPKLQKISFEKFVTMVNTDNAFDMLFLSIEHKNEELRQKAFEEIKKNHGYMEGLEENWQNHSNAFEKILELKKKHSGKVGTEMKTLMDVYMED